MKNILFIFTSLFFITSHLFSQDPKGAVIICNHWTQFGIGKTFTSGEVNGKWYNENFSMIFGLEQGRRYCAEKQGNKICHELDAYFLVSIAKEDPAYLGVIKNEIAANRMELVGGTYGQAESQVFGYESAIRQFTYGQKTLLDYTGKKAQTYIVEEQNYFSQLPQILLKTGFKYASLQFQNSGTPGPEIDNIVIWKGLDNSGIITVPNNKGLVSCTTTKDDPLYKTPLKSILNYKTPFIFQWIELWVPGYDWGASVEPYYNGLSQFYELGFKPMLLTEFIDWASTRSPLSEIAFEMDKSNYANNFYNGGWGYENEKTARGSNQSESMLLTLEALQAADLNFENKLNKVLPDLWSRLLVSQNHDPYLAGTVPAFINGIKTFQSELAVNEFNIIKASVKEKTGISNLINKNDDKIILFNPCPWKISVPVMFELNETQKTDDKYLVNKSVLTELFRSDNGNITLSPTIVELDPYAAAEYSFKILKDENTSSSNENLLQTSDNGKTWKVRGSDEIIFSPLQGSWKTTEPFFYEPPMVNTELIYRNIENSPSVNLKSFSSGKCSGYTWKNDLMLIKHCPEPAVSVANLVYATQSDITMVEFQQRLTSNPVIATGSRPDSTWHFTLTIPSGDLKIFADSPYGEEERKVSQFYCSRYIRIEMKDKQLLWCPSQNTQFRRVDSNGLTTIELTVLDYKFSGTTNWGMRFYIGTNITTAQSMKLAETFHRKPVIIPEKLNTGKINALACDNNAVLVYHVFGDNETGLNVRVVNTTNRKQAAKIELPENVKSVLISDFEGNPADISALKPKADMFEYTFMPWEIATFSIKF
jgi:hypothetical protein